MDGHGQWCCRRVCTLDTNELGIRSSKLQLNQQDNGNCASAIQQGAHIFWPRCQAVWNLETMCGMWKALHQIILNIGQPGKLSRAGPLPDDSQHFFESMMIFLRAPMGGRWRCMYRFPERQKPLSSDDGWLRFLSPQNTTPINLKMNHQFENQPTIRWLAQFQGSFKQILLHLSGSKISKIPPAVESMKASAGPELSSRLAAAMKARTVMAGETPGKPGACGLPRRLGEQCLVLFLFSPKIILRFKDVYTMDWEKSCISGFSAEAEEKARLPAPVPSVT